MNISLLYVYSINTVMGCVHLLISFASICVYTVTLCTFPVIQPDCPGFVILFINHSVTLWCISFARVPFRFHYCAQLNHGHMLIDDICTLNMAKYV